jgi:hypothetical protein
MQANGIITSAAVLATLVCATPAEAQVLAQTPPAPTCNEGRGVLVGHLGFLTVTPVERVNLPRGRAPLWSFSREPVIGGVDGPGVGRLREGDVLVAVDGDLITTGAGGLRYSSVRPGERVSLTLRRDGRMEELTLTAGERCWSWPLPPPAAPAPPPPPQAAPPASSRPPQVAPPPSRQGSSTPTPSAPSAQVPPARPPAAPAPPPPAPGVAAGAWLGFSLECRQCEIVRSNGRARMHFGAPPAIVSVEPSTPAYAAGLRSGDILTHVDDSALTSARGADRFASMVPGRAVRLTLTRDGRPFTATLVPRMPPATGSADNALNLQQLRHSGVVGGVQVEVRGAPVTVTTDPATGETVIRSQDLIVRLQPR